MCSLVKLCLFYGLQAECVKGLNVPLLFAGLSWFVPLKPSKPWRKPLKERQAFSVSQEFWEPKSVSQSTWKDIVHGDVLKDKSDITNVSRDTKFDLDTTGQPIRDEESMSNSDESDEDIVPSKPLSKMTLQVSFEICKGKCCPKSV